MNILITGGAKGVGASVVRKLAESPSNTVYFTYAASETAAKNLADTSANITAIHADFTDPASLDALIAEIGALDLDVLVNNAWPAFHQQHFHKTDPAGILNSFTVNVLATVKITQAAIGAFRKKKSGRIITVLSSAILNRPPVGWSDYVANKNYLLSMSKSWAVENARFRITSNAISPSFMQTDFTAFTDERLIEQQIEAHPLKALLTTDEVAEAVLFFCYCSLHINGVHLPINAAENLL
jgi:NAD(P)-dependent dehydrogenase (short-subunit alcohol dehydrogenase family)